MFLQHLAVKEHSSFFYLLNSDITGGVVHNYAFSCIHRHIRCRQRKCAWNLDGAHAVVVNAEPLLPYTIDLFCIAAKLFYEGKVAEAVSMVVEYQKKHPDKPVHKLSQQDIESIQTVASYLSDHYAFDIPLERLTQIACMGTTKLKSCFKKYYDCTITEYIQQRRMSQAEYLLAYTELTVGQVAQTVGYSTSSRFAELFRKSTGLLPLEYRKTAQRK